MEKSNQFKTKVNQDQEFTFDKEQINSLDIVPVGKDSFHIIKENKTYKAQIISTDFENKKYVIEVNGMEHTIEIQDQYDLLVQKMGLNAAAGNKMKDVKAPMPGLVLEILIKEGQEIQKGDPLLILEAMKMENVIKATGEGTIKAIKSEKGDAVNKGDIMIELA